MAEHHETSLFIVSYDNSTGEVVTRTEGGVELSRVPSPVGSDISIVEAAQVAAETLKSWYN